MSSSLLQTGLTSWEWLTTRLRGAGEVIPRLTMRLVMGWEFWESGLEKLHGDNWFADAQNELYRQVVTYMEKEGLNQTELACRLGVTKGYISQILKGDFNYTLKKLIAMGLLPDTPITLIGKKPAYLFSIQNSRFAVDEELAKNIFIRP